MRDFVSRAARVGRLHCTMLRRSGDGVGGVGGGAGGGAGQGVSYTLYLEHLGGLVPLLKGRRISKIRPEFVIFDPQSEGGSYHSYEVIKTYVFSEIVRNASSTWCKAYELILIFSERMIPGKQYHGKIE